MGLEFLKARTIAALAEITGVLGHVPWFTPEELFEDPVKAHVWAFAMRGLMPLQAALFALRGGIPSPARLSEEFVLPRVELGQKAKDIIAEWWRIWLGEERR